MSQIGCTVGILVGGRGRRMGGVAKGMLSLPSAPEGITERLLHIARGLADRVVLVGNTSSYAPLDCETLADAPSPAGRTDAGPLAGLVSLLSSADSETAVALACDLPYLTARLLHQLVSCPFQAAALAPRVSTQRGELWEPLFARYRVRLTLPTARARLARGELSLQGLLEEIGAEALPLSATDRAELRDWDSPEDVAAATNDRTLATGRKLRPDGGDP